MYTINIVTSGVIAAGDKKSLSKATEQALVRVVNENTNILYKAVVKNTPIGVTKLMRNSIRRILTVFGNKTVTGEVYIRRNSKAFQYAAPLEKGRTSSKWPPKGALISWMMLKYGISKKKAESREFLLRKHIAEHGTVAALMFFKAIYESYSRIQANSETLADKIEKGLTYDRKRY